MTFVVLVSLFLASSGDGGSHIAAAYREFSDPAGDVTKALGAKNFSLQAIREYTTLVPGVEGDPAILRSKFSIEVIKGTSDFIPDEHADEYNRNAAEYASRYNRLLLKALGCDYRNPMKRCESFP